MSEWTILRDLPAHVAGEIETMIPDLRDCREVAGRFDLARLNAEGVRTPAVLVSLLRVGPDTQFAGGHHAFLLHLGAFIITKDELGRSRDAVAAEISQAILGRVAGEDWGRGDCGESRDIRTEPIVSQGTLKARASLWAVTWRQPCILRPLDPGAPRPIQLFVGQAPEIGAGHADEYDEVGTPG